MIDNFTTDLLVNQDNAVCFYCSKPAVKTDGNGVHICMNRAMTNTCFFMDEVIGDKKIPVIRLLGINGNTKCPCGSGKKYKNCCKLKNK